VPEEVGGAGDNYVFLSSMIHAHADDLFQGMKVKGCYQFRLTRNADLALDSEDVEDLARALRGELFSRRYGDAVRLEVADTCPKHLSDYLLKQFNLSETELYQVNGPVNLTRLFSITGLDSHPELQYTPFTPQIPKLLQNSENIFSVISKQDILLLHPFESFTPVVDLLRQAAKDPHVLAVRQTLYRSGANSEIVDALVDAARNGKEVTAVIELRALRRRVQPATGQPPASGRRGGDLRRGRLQDPRQDDADPAPRAGRDRALRAPGYRQLPRRQRPPVHRLQPADLRRRLCEDVGKLFSQLIGMGKTLRMKKLLHAPFTLKKGMLDMIARETQFALDGKPAHIIAKFNSLTDPKIIRALYKASQSGVRIDLVVRGMCCLRPGIAGVSHNIHVRSIIGRFLEHTRVFYFLNGGEEQMFLSSADWMERNLDKRVETCFPVEGKKLLLRVKKELELPDRQHPQLEPAVGRPLRAQHADRQPEPAQCPGDVAGAAGQPDLPVTRTEEAEKGRSIRIVWRACSARSGQSHPRQPFRFLAKSAWVSWFRPASFPGTPRPGCCHWRSVPPGHLLGAADVVEQDREAQQHAQANQLDAVVAEIGELVLGNVAAVAAHQQREHLLVFAGEAGQVRVLDQVGAMLVVVVVGDVQAHFMHLGGPAEQFAPDTVFQIPILGHLIERMQGLALDPHRLFQIDVVALHQRGQGALAHVFVVMATQQVVEHAFTQRAFTMVHALQFEGVEDGFENRQAGREDGAAVRLDAFEVDLLDVAELEQFALEPGQALGVHFPVPWPPAFSARPMARMVPEEPMASSQVRRCRACSMLMISRRAAVYAWA
jgi:hypothetical protein